MQMTLERPPAPVCRLEEIEPATFPLHPARLEGTSVTDVVLWPSPTLCGCWLEQTNTFRLSADLLARLERHCLGDREEIGLWCRRLVKQGYLDQAERTHRFVFRQVVRRRVCPDHAHFDDPEALAAELLKWKQVLATYPCGCAVSRNYLRDVPDAEITHLDHPVYSRTCRWHDPLPAGLRWREDGLIPREELVYHPCRAKADCDRVYGHLFNDAAAYLARLSIEPWAGWLASVPPAVAGLCRDHMTLAASRGLVAGHTPDRVPHVYLDRSEEEARNLEDHLLSQGNPPGFRVVAGRPPEGVRLG